MRGQYSLAVAIRLGIGLVIANRLADGERLGHIELDALNISKRRAKSHCKREPKQQRLRHAECHDVADAFAVSLVKRVADLFGYREPEREPERVADAEREFD